MNGLAIALTAVLGWIGIAVIVGLLFCCVPGIKAMIHTMRHKRRSPHARLVAAGIDVAKLDISRETTAFEIDQMFRNGWDKHIRQRAAERVALENETSHGEPIWLSLYAKGGSMKHWAVLIHRQKYELRRTRNKAPPEGSEDVNRNPETAHNEKNELHREQIDDVANWSGFGRYYERMIREDLSYDQNMEPREAAIKAGRRPEVGMLYILHVGWTRKTKQEVDAAREQVEQTFGTYNLIFNNCQNFVQRLATEVVDQKSEDWEWFQRLSPTTYDYERPETIGPPGGVARLCINKLETAKSTQQLTDPQVLDALDQQIEVLERYLRGLEPTYANFRVSKSMWSDSAPEWSAWCGLCMLEGCCIGCVACLEGCTFSAGSPSSGLGDAGFGDAGAGGY